jgi:hypothetical protein
LLLVVVVGGCGASVVVGSAIAPAREGICGAVCVGNAVRVGVRGVPDACRNGGDFGVYGGGGVGFITTRGGGPSLRFFFSNGVLAIDGPAAAVRSVGDRGDVRRIPAGTSPSLLSSTTACSTF